MCYVFTQQNTETKLLIRKEKNSERGQGCVGKISKEMKKFFYRGFAI